MAIEFGKMKGSAKKAGASYMKLTDGDNVFRIVGGVLPGYTYWVKGAQGNNFPFEALQFDRNTEEFDNSRGCPVRDAGVKNDKGEDLNCQWAYKCQVINKATGELEVLQLKKGMLSEIITVAQDMEIDPTDPVTGTWLTVNRAKTGPKSFNVEYKLRQMKCKSEPLTEAELEIIKDLKPIEEIFPVETYDKQAARLNRHLTGQQDDSDDGADKEAVDELNG
jgi:hypothetical protein